MATQAAAAPAHHDNGVSHETKGSVPYDLESQQGGASLGRQLSIQLTHEQFERLYLQPGGVQSKGDLSKRLGNPTPLGVAAFLLVLTPFSCLLMGWSGATTNGAATEVGAYYYVGGAGLFLAGIGEWIIGNTFPSVVFITFGGYWAAFGFLLQPNQAIAMALEGSTTPDYNRGIALYLVWWAVLVLIYFIASLRTNVVFALLFAFLDVVFWTLVVAYLRLGDASYASVPRLLKVGGAFSFLTAACGWYLLVVLLFGSTGVPIALPVGDLSGFMTRRKKEA